MKSLVLAIAISLASVTACNFTITGSGNNNETEIVGSSAEQTRSFELSAFDDLTISIPCDVVYESGAPKVVVVASEKYMEHILVEQNSDGSVIIKSDGSKIRSFKNTRIYVTSDRLSALTVNGAVDMECKHGIRSAGNFDLTLNGAGDLEIKGLDADNIDIRCNGAADIEILDICAVRVNVTINGAGDATLSGDVDEAALTINGAGDINARGLNARSIRPSVRGIGSIVTR